MLTPHRGAASLCTTLVAFLICGCGTAPPKPGASGYDGSHSAGILAATDPPSPSAQAYPAYTVTALVPVIEVRLAPAGPLLARLENPRPSGARLTFLLDRQQPGWLKVFLPVRPNGSEGWIRAADVSVKGDAYRLDIHVDAHRLDLFGYDQLLRSFPVGIGRVATPTPGGIFYLVELVRPPTPGGPYGPFAYGLSGHSTTLSSFAGSDAVIGLHGTDDPSGVGHDVSHGCLRMFNSDITYLATLLPLGTPVRILS